MPFTVKDWRNSEEGPPQTPLSAEDLEDLEERVTDYADSVGAGGVELGYADITADATTTSGSFVDVSGLSVTVTKGSRPIVIKFSCGGVESTNNPGLGQIRIVEDGTSVGVLNWYLAAANTPNSSPMREVRRNPSAGSHTYKIQFTRTAFGAGTFKIKADSGAGFGPASIQVVEV